MTGAPLSPGGGVQPAGRAEMSRWVHGSHGTPYFTSPGPYPHTSILRTLVSHFAAFLLVQFPEIGSPRRLPLMTNSPSSASPPPSHRPPHDRCACQATPTRLHVGRTARRRRDECHPGDAAAARLERAETRPVHRDGQFGLSSEQFHEAVEAGGIGRHTPAGPGPGAVNGE